MKIKEVAAKWSTNETLLQSYRSIFISSQSFLLAVGVLSFDRSNWLLIILAEISVFMIWYIWFPVVKTRHRFVDYHKYALELSEEEQSKLCEVKKYVEDKEERKQANIILKLCNGQWRLTRKKVDILIPCFFICIWVCLLILKIIEHGCPDIVLLIGLIAAQGFLFLFCWLLCRDRRKTARHD
ncbi:MAG: hypothetical protein GH143_01355 [Calditrichaeota bacterium]|nr:hypothetical protein [Calditrichota bacterium]